MQRKHIICKNIENFNINYFIMMFLHETVDKNSSIHCTLNGCNMNDGKSMWKKNTFDIEKHENWILMGSSAKYISRKILRMLRARSHECLLHFLTDRPTCFSWEQDILFNVFNAYVSASFSNTGLKIKRYSAIKICYNPLSSIQIVKNKDFSRER